MEKKLMIDPSIRKFCIECKGDSINLHPMNLYSYDYIKNTTPETFKNVKYFILDSCKYFITAKEVKCYAEFRNHVLDDNIILVTINGVMCAINSESCIKELINIFKKEI